MKTNIYIAAYRSSFKGYDESSCGKAWRGLSAALERGEWPYDVGDDPAFFSRRKFGGNLTWGICRQQVRNAIEPADIVVFFSFRSKEDGEATEYRLCAVATVERKVSQAQIWREPSLALYRAYLNLLIRPAKGAWEHYEPGSKDAGHKDWLWRIADRKDFRRKDFERLQKEHLLSVNARLRGCKVTFSDNYVIFSSKPQESKVLAEPPLVAWSKRNGKTEKWQQDDFSLAVQEHTLEVAHRYGVSKSRSLRSQHLQHRHPPVRWKMPADAAVAWRAQFLELLQAQPAC